MKSVIIYNGNRTKVIDAGEVGIIVIKYDDEGNREVIGGTIHDSIEVYDTYVVIHGKKEERRGMNIIPMHNVMGITIEDIENIEEYNEAEDAVVV